MDVTNQEIKDAAKKFASNNGDMSKLSFKEQQIVASNKNQVSSEGRLIRETEKRAQRGY